MCCKPPLSPCIIIKPHHVLKCDGPPKAGPPSLFEDHLPAIQEGQTVVSEGPEVDVHAQASRHLGPLTRRDFGIVGTLRQIERP